MACAETLKTQAFIDGDVQGAQAEAAERHIAGCRDCQAFCAEAATLSDAIRTEAPRHTAPPALRQKVEAALAGERRKRASPGFWRGAASGAVATALAAGIAALAFLPTSPAALSDRLVAAHTAALMQDREIAVVSTDHHTVKPWFAGRIALSPPVADFASQGYTLTGGRLDTVAGAPAAVVAYRHGKHAVDLYVWADRGAPLPPRGESQGYHLVYWKRSGLDFAVVSDTSPAELTAFVDLVRALPE